MPKSKLENINHAVYINPFEIFLKNKLNFESVKKFDFLSFLQG